MRALLDELALHVPLTPVEHDSAPDGSNLEKAVRLSVDIEGELDARLVQLCCPQLNQALQVGFSLLLRGLLSKC